MVLHDHLPGRKKRIFPPGSPAVSLIEPKVDSTSRNNSPACRVFISEISVYFSKGLAPGGKLLLSQPAVMLGGTRTRPAKPGGGSRTPPSDLTWQRGSIVPSERLVKSFEVEDKAMRNLLSLALMLGLIAVLVGCQPQQSQPTKPTPAPTGGPQAVTGPAAPTGEAQPAAQEGAKPEEQEAQQQEEKPAPEQAAPTPSEGAAAPGAAEQDQQ